MENKKLSKPKNNATVTEKQKWKEYLKNETIEQRTSRVLNPRLNKILVQMHKFKKCTASNNYRLSKEQGEDIIATLAEELDAIHNAINGSSKDFETRDII